jgi:hypothetical protein
MAKAKILTRLEGQLRAKGMAPGKAAAVAISTLQRAGDLKKGSTEPTPKGIQRGNMGADSRAKDRAAKASGHKPGDFSHSKKTNRATLKK